MAVDYEMRQKLSSRICEARNCSRVDRGSNKMPFVDCHFGQKTILLKLEREELSKKIAHYCRLLSGEQIAFVTVGNDFCSVI